MTTTRPAVTRFLDQLKAELTAGSFGPKSLSLSALVALAPWQSRLSDHFVLQYYDDTHCDDGLIDRLAAGFERIYAQLMVCMDIAPRSKQERIACEMKLTCIVVRTPSPRTFGTIESPGVLFYLLDPRQDPQYMRKFRHEIAHLVWGRSYGEAPPLFNEGVAVYAETASDPLSGDAHLPHVTAEALDALPPLVELAQTDTFWEAYGHGHPVYQAGALWVHYLVERWGWETLGALFLASEYEDPDIASRFRALYGQDMESAEADWRHALAQGERIA